jgi:hypothetical protein
MPRIGERVARRKATPPVLVAAQPTTPAHATATGSIVAGPYAGPGRLSARAAVSRAVHGNHLRFTRAMTTARRQPTSGSIARVSMPTAMRSCVADTDRASAQTACTTMTKARALATGARKRSMATRASGQAR